MCIKTWGGPLIFVFTQQMSVTSAWLLTLFPKAALMNVSLCSTAEALPPQQLAKKTNSGLQHLNKFFGKQYENLSRWRGWFGRTGIKAEFLLKYTICRKHKVTNFLLSCSQNMIHNHESINHLKDFSVVNYWTWQSTWRCAHEKRLGWLSNQRLVLVREGITYWRKVKWRDKRGAGGSVGGGWLGINSVWDRKAKQLTRTVTFWMQSTKCLLISMDLYCTPKMAAKYVQLG